MYIYTTHELCVCMMEGGCVMCISFVRASMYHDDPCESNGCLCVCWIMDDRPFMNFDVLGKVIARVSP